MGCPDAIRAALEGLAGITQVSFNLQTRTFKVEGSAAEDRTAVEAAVAAAGNFAVLDWQSGKEAS
ncbi:MAG: heavy-metal-associated domain-containing protein [Planctomycetes bacterium]|nr:heavy-metal-associated domain-containing protein [Planctomycetota bacterium]